MRNSRLFTVVGQVLCLIASFLFTYPLILMIAKSFDKKGGANYLSVLDKVKLWPNFQTSFIVVVGTLFIVAVISSTAAFAFSKLKFRFREQIYFILLMGMMIPTAALVFPLFRIVRFFGINNTPFSLILPYATLNALFNLLVYKNFFDGLPNELMEAAEIDGAGLMRMFVRIMLPLSVPGLSLVLTQTFLLSWNELQMAMTFINKTAIQPVSVVPLRFMQASSNSYPLGVMYACLVICLTPIALFYILSQKLLISGLAAGAVKG